MRWSALLVVLLALLLSARIEAFAAASVTMRYATEEFGRREVLTFVLPDGIDRPQLSLTDAKVLRMSLPGVLALPTPTLDAAQTRFIERMQVESMPAGRMGIFLTIYLKEPYLDFRDSLKDTVYRLVIERYPVTFAVGPTRLLEGRVLAGRDGTLAIISFAGNGWVEKSVDYGARSVHLRWPGASLGQSWRSIPPEGMAERLDAYEFARYQVEMEIGLNPAVGEVHFYRNAEAGTMIVELRTQGGLGRANEAEEIIRMRKEALQQGNAKPLNRLTPIFVNGSKKVILLKTPVDEAHYMDNALKYEQDYNYGKAINYVDGLLRVFPDSNNREVLDLYRMDLVNKLDWNPGRKLSDLETILARYPNNHDYPHFRLMQFRLFNRSGQYENASAIMFDPNLPKNSPEVLLERGRTAIGLRQWGDGEKYLNQVLAADKSSGNYSAEANYLLARLAQRRNDGEAVIRLLDNLSTDHLTRIADQPEWLLEIADIYFNRQQYAKALNLYIRLITSYPEDTARASQALLRAAGANRSLEKVEESLRLYERLLREYPQSESATWARIYKLQLETGRSLEDRLADLDAIIREASFSEAVVEANLNRSILLGEAKRHKEAIVALNNLLTLTAREEPVRRANELKHRFMVAGMKDALENQRPEYAVALAESYGADWRKDTAFQDARLLLAEALLRLNMVEPAQGLLKKLKEAPGPELIALANAFAIKTPLAAGQRELEEEEAVRAKISPEAARVRLAEASRLAHEEGWESILILLEYLPEERLNKEEQAERLRLLAKAEAGRGRFPQAVSNLERLLYERPMGDGMDYFWYATLLQLWKGDSKSLSAFQKVANEAENKEIQALARIRVGDILQRKGEVALAQTEFLTSAKLNPGTLWSKVADEIRKQLDLVK